MKRLLSIFITLALLISALVIPTNVFAGRGSWVDKTSTSKLYDFDSEASITSLKAMSSASLASFIYDSSEDAMKITSNSAAANTATVVMSSDFDPSLYPVAAVMVKADNPTGKIVNLSYGGKEKTAALAATTDWQLVLVEYDATTIAALGTNVTPYQVTVDWYRGAASSIGDTYYVKWAGAFASVADACKCAGNVARFDGANVIEFNKANSTVAIVTGYDTANKVNGVQIRAYNTIASFSYDEREQALVFDSKLDGNSNDYNLEINCADLGISITEYPIVAYKAKWKDTPTATVTNGIIANNASNQGNWDALLQYNVSDWQIASTDYTGKFSAGDTYSTVQLKVVGSYTHRYGHTTPIDAYIDWVGFFATVEDAYAYDAECAIDDISYVIDTDDASVVAAETAYNALTEAQQAKVSNAAELTEASAVFATVEAIEAANGDEIISDTAKVVAANSAYYGLSTSIRARVGNYGTLQSLQKISGAVDRINELPEAVDYTGIEAYDRATTAIAALSEEEALRVGNITVYNGLKDNFEALKSADVGDIDFDGDVDICDLVVLHLFVAGSDVTFITNPDLNGDDTVDAADMAVLRQTIINK